MYTFTQNLLSPNCVGYKVFDGENGLSFSDVLNLWQENETFTAWFTTILTDCSFEAFRWETPVLTRSKTDRLFEFVLVNAQSFARRATDQRAFSRYFDDGAVVSFPNLGGDSLMIVPCPCSEFDVYGHFASFLRGAPQSQITDMWRTIGREVSARIDDTPKWLSTAGGGVAWLHVRLDSRPKYYHHSPYKDVNYVGS